MDFSHIDAKGRAVMVDVSGKPKVKRTARAAGKITMHTDTIEKIKKNQLKKGDVLSTAKIAAVAGAKRTSDLIPLCHNISIDYVDVEFTLTAAGVEIESTAVCTDKTGIEMEALTAVAIAALTIYDMCKAVDKNMQLSDIRLVEKTKETLK
jgi:cyclic pyranopterin phosphate synthase